MTSVAKACGNTRFLERHGRHLFCIACGHGLMFGCLFSPRPASEQPPILAVHHDPSTAAARAGASGGVAPVMFGEDKSRSCRMRSSRRSLGR